MRSRSLEGLAVEVLRDRHGEALENRRCHIEHVTAGDGLAGACGRPQVPEPDSRRVFSGAREVCVSRLLGDRADARRGDAGDHALLSVLDDQIRQVQVVPVYEHLIRADDPVTTGSPESASVSASSSRVRSAQASSYSAPGSIDPKGSRPRTFSRIAPFARSGPRRPSFSGSRADGPAFRTPTSAGRGEGLGRPP